MEEFESLCQHGYLAIRKHSRHLLQLLEINSFSGGEGTGLPCLQGDAVDEVKRRLKLSCTDRDAEKVSPTLPLLSRVSSAPHLSASLSPHLSTSLWSRRSLAPCVSLSRALTCSLPPSHSLALLLAPSLSLFCVRLCLCV